MNRRDILVVDDNSENVRVLSGLLERQGFEVAACLSGEKALRAMERSAPDLVLLDVNMPGLDGFQTCARIRAQPKFRQVPIIFLTARTSTEDVVRGFRSGAVDYVAKPFQPEELLARIWTHLELHRSREEILELRALLPVCSWCHKIRSDEGYWESMERYIQAHGGPRVTHGICPDCMEKLRDDHGAGKGEA